MEFNNETLRKAVKYQEIVKFRLLVNHLTIV